MYFGPLDDIERWDIFATFDSFEGRARGVKEEGDEEGRGKEGGKGGEGSPNGGKEKKYAVCSSRGERRGRRGRGGGRRRGGVKELGKGEGGRRNVVGGGTVDEIFSVNCIFGGYCYKETVVGGSFGEGLVVAVVVVLRVVVVVVMFFLPL